jgi:hypothetical protein
MAAFIYSLCALTCVITAVLLLRSYQKTHVHMLLWSGLCFIGLTISNVFLILDRIVYPSVDFSIPRLSSAFIGLLLLLYGLIWEGD